MKVSKFAIFLPLLLLSKLGIRAIEQIYACECGRECTGNTGRSLEIQNTENKCNRRKREISKLRTTNYSWNVDHRVK
jgi:hypothetical protein